MGLLRARSVVTAEAELLKSAVAMRWSRPDLTAAVAEHVATTWAADNRTWVAATGWLVHGRAAVGDGRECASDALAELVRRDPALLDDPAADRLRIEVATLAAAQREPAVARKLVEPLGRDRPPEVRADALAVLARCAFEDRPAAVGEATRRATEAWAAVRGADAEIAVAALTFLSATAARRAGHPAAAADHAAEGLARLDDLRPGASAPHLVAALAAEWISALVEAGRAEDACAACAATAKHLVPPVRPTRQIALLRLTVARALAESSSPGAFEALEQAAADASACDAPDLEGLCLSTLGTLREHAGRLDAALESMRRGVAAQRRDRARSERFRAALGALPLTSGAAAPVGAAGRQDSPLPLPAIRRRSPRGQGGRTDQPHPLAANPWTTGRWTSEPPWSGDGVRRPVRARRGRSPARRRCGAPAPAGLPAAPVRHRGRRTGLRRTTPRSTRCSGRWARSASRSSWASPQARRREGSRGLPVRRCGRGGQSPRRRELAGDRARRSGACVGRTVARARAHGRPATARTSSGAAVGCSVLGGDRRPGSRRGPSRGDVDDVDEQPRAPGRLDRRASGLVRSRKAQEAATVWG